MMVAPHAVQHASASGSEQMMNKILESVALWKHELLGTQPARPPHCLLLPPEQCRFGFASLSTLRIRTGIPMENQVEHGLARKRRVSYCRAEILSEFTAQLTPCHLSQTHHVVIIGPLSYFCLCDLR